MERLRGIEGYGGDGKAEKERGRLTKIVEEDKKKEEDQKLKKGEEEGLKI